jgi:small subunit ribosomal protein S7
MTRQQLKTPFTMPPRLNFFGTSRSLVIRARPSIASHQPWILPVVSRRGFADEKDSNAPKGPNEDVLGHVSEEAADLGRVMGETEPDLGQGTPVQDVRRRISQWIASMTFDLRTIY